MPGSRETLALMVVAGRGGLEEVVGVARVEGGRGVARGLTCGGVGWVGGGGETAGTVAAVFDSRGADVSRTEVQAARDRTASVAKMGVLPVMGVRLSCT